MDNNIADSKEFSPSTNDKELAEYQEALENKRKNFIVFDNVTKEYKNEEVKTVALSEVSFVIPEGELVIFLGHSGAGKTTALNMLGGMDIVTSGTITVDGKRITDYNIDQLTEYRKNDIGFVFQFFNLIQNLTVKENIELSTEIKGTTPDVKALLQKIDLENKIDKFPSQLSGGEQQRVSIVRAIAKKPRILLCDEPTGSLDYKTGKQILSLIQKTCREEKVTTIIITHNRLIADMADRIISFNSGRVVDVKVNENPTPVEDLEW
ncbi:MAG: ABC transporter ATP-binding protein [Bacilli bacterium]|nr:ABC transporter ATP-binding protein [Bacilli bacterium]